MQYYPSQRKTWRNIALAATAVLMLVGGFALMAHGGHGGTTLFAHGGLGHGGLGHGGLGHGGQIAQFHHAFFHLVEELGLTPEQQDRIETIHETLMTRHQVLAGEHLEHVAQLAERIESGELDPVEARARVDRHLEDIRLTAYTVVDEVVALINSLDDSQRAVLLEHLEQAQAHLDRATGHAR